MWWGFIWMICYRPPYHENIVSGQLPRGRLPPDDSPGGRLPRRTSSPEDDSPGGLPRIIIIIIMIIQDIYPAGESSSRGVVLRGSRPPGESSSGGVVLRRSCPPGESSSGGVVLRGSCQVGVVPRGVGGVVLEPENM